MPNWTTHYAAIHHPNARYVARSAALSTLAAIGEATGRTAAALARPRVHFIYLHHIFKDEIEPFRRLLDSLLKIMTPIGYSDAVDRCIRGPIDKPYLAFSFDDGFKNCLDAADVLEEVGARACFFVCNDIVGERDEKKIVDFARDRLHLPPIEFMTWEDLDSLALRGHEIGNHTVDHLRLTTSAPFEMKERAERIELGRRTPNLQHGRVRHFAWPYGNFKSMNAVARLSAFASGHASCASGVRGAHVVPAKDMTSLCIRRDHVIAAWPLGQVRYLLAQSAKKATATDNDWPASW